MSDTAKETWNIWVSGYGQFEFEGTEAEAEEMRRHKSWWEHGVGWKWRKTNQRESDRLTQKVIDLWDNHEGAPRRLLTRRKAALDKEKLHA